MPCPESRSEALNRLRLNCVIPAAPETPQVWDLSVDEILDWIDRYDCWYRKTGGITETENLNLLYNREFWLHAEIGDTLLAALPRIGEAITERDLSFGLCFHLSRFVSKDGAAFEDLLAAFRNTGVGQVWIKMDAAGALPAANETVQDYIAALMDNGQSVTLLGQPSAWIATGIMDNLRIVNRSIQILRHASNAQRERQLLLRPNPELTVHYDGRLYLYPDDVSEPARALGNLRHTSVEELLMGVFKAETAALQAV